MPENSQDAVILAIDPGRQTGVVAVHATEDQQSKWVLLHAETFMLTYDLNMVRDFRDAVKKVHKYARQHELPLVVITEDMVHHGALNADKVDQIRATERVNTVLYTQMLQETMIINVDTQSPESKNIARRIPKVSIAAYLLSILNTNHEKDAFYHAYFWWVTSTRRKEGSLIGCK